MKRGRKNIVKGKGVFSRVRFCLKMHLKSSHIIHIHHVSIYITRYVTTYTVYAPFVLLLHNWSRITIFDSVALYFHASVSWDELTELQCSYAKLERIMEEILWYHPPLFDPSGITMTIITVFGATTDVNFIILVPIYINQHCLEVVIDWSYHTWWRTDWRVTM